MREHLDSNGNVIWPADEHARCELAQALLGIHWIKSCDALYESASDVVSNPSPPQPYVRPESAIARKDAYFRRVFSTLNTEQRQAVLQLLHEQTYGVLCALVYDVDQFPYSTVTVTLSNRTDEPSYLVQAVPGPNGIGVGESWAGWVRDFASFPNMDANRPR